MIALLLAGCPADPVPDVSECESPTWEDFAQGYVRTWCTPCHTSSLAGADRHGAPEGIDFDRWSQVYDWRERIAVRATGDGADMPPVGGVDPADVERFGRWLACGAEGSDPTPGPCDVRIPGPAATVSSQADADALCAVANQVPALTVTGAATIDCLCAVDGALVVQADVRLPVLSEVGSLAVDAGSVDAPALERSGALGVTGGVTSLSLPVLQTVTGDVSLTDLTALDTVALDGLVTVGGDWRVARSPTLATVAIPRLRTVGGDFVGEDLSALVTLDGTRALERIGGSVLLHRMPRLPALDDWAFLLLAEVGGDVVIEDNARLLGIHGFALLPALAGSVRIERNGQLVRIDGFDNLVEVGGDLQIRGNPRQEHVLGFVNLERVDGALVLEDLPALRSVAGFEAVRALGAVSLVRVRLPRIDGFSGLRSVSGDLRLAENPALALVDGWLGLESVSGALEVQDNPVLPTSTVETWVGGIDVGGAVLIEGNGPG